MDGHPNDGDLWESINIPEKRCENCKHLTVEGGDWVPYGMGSTQLPTNSYCEHPITEDMDENEYDLFSEVAEKLGNCEHWEGGK